VHGEGCVGLTVRTALHATHRELCLIELEQPLTFPLNVAWRTPTRPVAEAVFDAIRDVRREEGWR
jgi:hypothetical protein